MSHGKQFTLYSNKGAPNGWKVAVVLEELGLAYETIYLDFTSKEHKQPAYTQYNPNGRIPALIDHHNGDYVVWESGAILLYLVDTYDKEHKLSVADDKKKHTLIQWLFFQASGQGPYVGQALWFTLFHAEKIPSAIERYQAETRRIASVLDGVLAASPSGYLVGGKVTVADLAFVQWNKWMLDFPLKEVDVAKDYPAFWAWHQRLTARESYKKAVALQEKLKQQ